MALRAQGRPPARCADGKVKQMEIPEITQGVWREGHESHLNRLQDSPALGLRWLLTRSCCHSAGLAWIIPGSSLQSPSKASGQPCQPEPCVHTCVCVCVSGREGGGRTLLPAASTPRRALLGKIHLLWLHVGPEDSVHCAAALKSRRGIVNHAETVTWGVMKIYCTLLRSLAKK